MSIRPDAKALILCDHVFAGDNGKVHVLGIFNSARPSAPYPFTLARVCVFAQLVGGHGDVPFRVDIRRQDEDEPFRSTNVNLLNFPSRTAIVYVSLTIEDCTFHEPGVYVVELFCDNVWICDAALVLQAEGE